MEYETVVMVLLQLHCSVAMKEACVDMESYGTEIDWDRALRLVNLAYRRYMASSRFRRT